MLDEGFDVAGWAEDDDCGCLASTVLDDGERLTVHHWIPDDTAPHVPHPECGCGPAARESDGVLLYEHVDQDDPSLT